MIKSFVCCLLLFAVPLTETNCQQIDSKELPLQETEFIKFKKSWVRFDKPLFGKIYQYTLFRPEIINGVPCKSTLHISNSGDLYGFILAEEHQINGTVFPANSRYEARVNSENCQSGYMVFIPKDINIQGYNVRHKGFFLEEYKPDFYASGALGSFKSVSDVEIMGVPCKGGPKAYINLYPNGRLMVCTLSEKYTQGTKLFEKGSKLIFDESGIAYPYSREKHMEYFKEY